MDAKFAVGDRVRACRLSSWEFDGTVEEVSVAWEGRRPSYRVRLDPSALCPEGTVREKWVGEPYLTELPS